MSSLEFEKITYTQKPLLAIEGIVGAGKSTQVELMRGWLPQYCPGVEILFTHEPGDSQIADDIRKVVQGTPYSEEMDATCEALLCAASRAQTLRKLVRPVLDRGGMSVLDRSVVTSLAYQGFGRGLGVRRVIEINREAVEGLWPGRVLIIDTPMQTCLPRAKDKLGDKFESMGQDFFTRVRAGYLWLVDKYPNIFVTVDGAGTIEGVKNRLQVAILSFLNEFNLQI